MAEIDNGGRAFPTADDLDMGLTIRDWFAGQALASIIIERATVISTPEGMARDAYKLADAMIQAREKP